ncbi:hypothetical protein H2198_008297 [Neophaeococcomyces mojaviensis]|uniref:Uncharacterized protein n=1 Tax=Neophaeococcomyces mojaviensis TaxID=3383035 RepID=A0ACC2ZXM7_9EURO|nr:hypothetical protein H2198_008297 [Knufia sp. JES_112]
MRMEREVERIRSNGAREALPAEQIEMIVRTEIGSYTEEIHRLHHPSPPSETGSRTTDDSQSDTLEPTNSTWRYHLWYAMIAPSRKLGMKFFSTLIMIYSIISIEFMLKWNHISSVNNISSIGQLIPFVVGLTNVLKILIDIGHKYKTERAAWEAKRKASVSTNA